MTLSVTRQSRTTQELRGIAKRLRLYALTGAAGKGEAYIGQALQTAELFAVLCFDEMRWHPEKKADRTADHFILSVGHYALSYYAMLAEYGLLSEEDLADYGSDGSPLTLGTEPGHVPGIEFAGGSLGQGLGFATGLALGQRVQKLPGRVFNYMSDGETQEGTTWEAAMIAGHHQLSNLYCIVDVNRTQADGELVIEVEPLTEKFEAFGWWAVNVDGHDVEAIRKAFADAGQQSAGRPVAIIASTNLGQGSILLTERTNAHFVRVAAKEWELVRKEIETSL